MREGRAACAPRHKRGPFSFTKENGPLLIPQEKGIRLAVSDLNDSYASGMGMPARGIAAVGVAIRFDSLLLSAAALESNRRFSVIAYYR